MKLNQKGQLDLEYYFEEIEKRGIIEVDKWPKNIELSWYEGIHHKRTACIYMDIRKYSERVSKDFIDTYKYLQLFYLNSWEIISKYGGYVEKQTGDGIMIVYPIDDDEKILDPLKLANEILESTRNNLNTFMQSHNENKYIIGLGVDVSEVIVTKVGLPKHEHHLMLVGDSANMAAKMCELAFDSIYVGCNYKTLVDENFRDHCDFELIAHLPYTIGEHKLSEEKNYNVFKFISFNVNNKL